MVYGRSLLIRAEVMFDRRLSVWAALSRIALLTPHHWERARKVAPNIAFSTSSGRLAAVGMDPSQCGRNKKAKKKPPMNIAA